MLKGVEVLAPAAGLADVHDSFVLMASAGAATPAQRDKLLEAVVALTRDQVCEAISGTSRNANSRSSLRKYKVPVKPLNADATGKRYETF